MILKSSGNIYMRFKEKTLPRVKIWTKGSLPKQVFELKIWAGWIKVAFFHSPAAGWTMVLVPMLPDQKYSSPGCIHHPDMVDTRSGRHPESQQTGLLPGRLVHAE